MAVSFPRDILLEIFSRLPRKTLRKLEIVSKEWAILIKEAASLPAKSTDLGFLRFGDSCPNSNTLNPIFYRLDDKGALAVQDSLSFHPSGCLINYCNGVIVYRSITVGKGWSFHLYNPFTKHHTNLPPLHYATLPGLPQYDNHRVLETVGLAPHPETNHFKFIAIYSHPMPYGTPFRGLKVAIFDSETVEWKTKLVKFSDESREALDTGCKAGHWGRYFCFEHSLYWTRRSYLIGFCVKTETFRVLYLPETSNKFIGVLWASEGRLKYTQICPIEGLRIWVLRGVAKKIRGNWDMIFHISVPTLNSLLAEEVEFRRVLAFNEHLQMFHLQTNKDLYVYYDLFNKKMTLISPVVQGMNFVLPSPLAQRQVLPFAYRKYDLADLEGTIPGSATGRRGRSRKRNLTFSQTTLRRSARIRLMTQN